MVGEHPYLVFVHVQTVCDDQPRGKQPQFIEVAHGRKSEILHGIPYLPLRLGYVHLHQQSVLAREVVQPLQQLSGDGIDGVRGDGHLYALAIVLFHQFENLLGVLLGLFRQLRIEVVDVRIP